MSDQKIRLAAGVTDKVVEGFNKAQEHLRDCWVNGFGVLCDPSNVRHDLMAARAAIDDALNALNGLGDWPGNDDYD